MPRLSKKLFTLTHRILKKRLFFFLMVFIFLSLPLVSTADDPSDYEKIEEMAEKMSWGRGIKDALAKGIGLAADIAVKLLAGLLTLILWFAGGLMKLSDTLLDWAISNPWKIPYTIPGESPTGNPIIAAGWTLLRDLVNMLFVLGFAYIGLMTALSKTNFDTPKIFFNIILIALLINFTPVICGVIVDITNMISNFFLGGNLNIDKIWEAFDNQEVIVRNNLDGIFANGAVAIQLLLLIIYAILASIAFLIFALIFLFRGPIIWLLVILSPLAFFMWVFKDVNKQAATYWNDWWKRFLHYSFIAVPASFFLYLSGILVTGANNYIDTGNIANDPTATSPGFLAPLAPYIVSLIFMIFGLILTLKMSSLASAIGLSVAAMTGGIAWNVTKKIVWTPAGVGGAIKGAKEQGSKEYKETKGGKGKKIAGAAWGGLKGALKGFRLGEEEARESIRKTVEKTESYLEKAHLVRPGFSARTFGIEKIEGIGKILEKGKVLPSGFVEKIRGLKRTEIEKERERLKALNLTDDQKKEILERPALLHREHVTRAVIAEMLAEDKKFGIKPKTITDNDIKYKLYKDKMEDTKENRKQARESLIQQYAEEQAEKEKQIIIEIQKTGVDLKNIAKSRPDLAPIVKPEKVEKLMREKGMDREEAEIKVIHDTVEGTTPGDYLYFQPQSINLEVLLSSSTAQLRKAGKDGTDELRQAIEKTYKKNIDELIKMEESGDKEIKTKIRNIREELGKNPAFVTIKEIKTRKKRKTKKEKMEEKLKKAEQGIY